jgi:hypothetical protein
VRMRVKLCGAACIEQNNNRKMAALSVSPKRKLGGRRLFTLSEQKRKKVRYDKERRHSTVNIGDQFARWNELKDEIVASDHAAVAKYLLDW